MKKLICLSISLLFFSVTVKAQAPSIETLKNNLKKSLEDTSRVKALIDLSWGNFLIGSFDTAIYYAETSKKLAEKIGYKKGIASGYHNIGLNYRMQGKYTEALNMGNKALKIFQEINAKNEIAASYTNIGLVYQSTSNNSEALKNHFLSLKLYTETKNKPRIAGCHTNIGVIYYEQGKYTEAIKEYYSALKIHEEIGNKRGIAGCYGNIGNIYKEQKKYSEALKNYLVSLKIKEEIKDKWGIAATYGNIGSVYNLQGDYSEALKNFIISLNLAKEIDAKSVMINAYHNIGNLYFYEGKYSEALENFLASKKIAEEIGNKYVTAASTFSIGVIFTKQNKALEGKEWIQNGLNLSKAINSNSLILNAYEKLSIADSILGDFKSAYEHYKMYIIYKDSIFNKENTKKQTQIEMQYEFDKKETELKYTQQLTQEKLEKEQLLTIQQKQELDIKQQALILSNKEKDLKHLAWLKEKAEKEKQRSLSEKEKRLQQTKLELTSSELKAKENERNGFIAGTVLFLFLAIAIFTGLRKTSIEKKKSEKLLLNILPYEIAQLLKQTGEAEAKQYNNVTVLFTDFVNFTSISEQLSPSDLVAEIHKNFIAFDAIMERHGLEKIKTIGDAYMAVCGLPKETADHAQRVIRAAMDIQKHIQESDSKFQIRIGINSGSVVAGIVGIKKYAYDIWGDTVNTAARMEQNSEAGKINISGSTYEIIKDEFVCKHRGKIEAKGKGAIDMYFVEG